MSEWTVLLPDRLPAYITWERYLRNQQRMEENRRGNASKGTTGRGTALLAGLVVCGSCGRRMQVGYSSKDAAYYNCHKHLVVGTEQNCFGLKADPVDELVAAQVLRALAPAALEQQWEAALGGERQLRDEYDRFQHTSPTTLTEADRDRVRALAGHIPTLWTPDTVDRTRHHARRPQGHDPLPGRTGRRPCPLRQ